jgi:hypothetical protein
LESPPREVFTALPKETPLDREAADRIADAASRDPDSATARSGFPERADTAAHRNADEDDDEDCGADEQ